MLQQISWKIYIPFSMLHDWRLRSLWIIHLNYCLLLFGPISKDHGINSSLALWKGGRVFSKIPSNYFHSVLAQTKFCSIGSCFLTMYDFPAKNAVSWLLISSHSDSWPWKEKLRGLWNMFLAELQRCPFRSKIWIMSENTLHSRALKAVNVLQPNQTFKKANIFTSL